jgi:hypothetical protein
MKIHCSKSILRRISELTFSQSVVAILDNFFRVLSLLQLDVASLVFVLLFSAVLDDFNYHVVLFQHLLRHRLALHMHTALRFVRGDVAHQVSLMPERLAAVRTLVCLFPRRQSDVVWIVVDVLVSLQQLLLPERLFAELTLVGLLVRVDQHVRFEMACRDRRVGAKLATVALFTFVCFGVDLVGVAIREFAVAATALYRLVGGVELLHVDPEVGFTSARRRTELALENRLFADRVDHLVGLERIGLGEARLADVT